MIFHQESMTCVDLMAEQGPHERERYLMRIETLHCYERGTLSTYQFTKVMIYNLIEYIYIILYDA